MTKSVRLVVDLSLCDGYGICALRCPELITLDEWGFAGVEPGPVEDPRVLRRARRAVAACPRRALTLVAAESEPPVGRGPYLVAVPRPGHNAHRDRRERQTTAEMDTWSHGRR